jgi:hypothetical protein
MRATAGLYGQAVCIVRKIMRQKKIVDATVTQEKFYLRKKRIVDATVTQEKFYLRKEKNRSRKCYAKKVFSRNLYEAVF